MESGEKNPEPSQKRPPCFGDEVKFINYVENAESDCECSRCASEGDCGEFILLKCSRELTF